MAEREDNFTKLGDLVFFGQYPTYLEKNKDRIEELNALAGKLPMKGAPGKWTSYGYYIDGEPNDFMWHIDINPYEDRWYRGVYFTKPRPASCAKVQRPDTPTQIENGYEPNNVYWFSLEDMWWKVIKEDEKSALLLANDIIDAQAFYIPKEEGNRTINGKEICQNNYVYSDIRRWLNKDFLDYAFTKSEKKRIQKVVVDNSDPDNRFACENTEDHIFLLSCQEVEELFKDLSDRRVSTTDYAQCQGALTGQKDTYVDGQGQWWLRTPDDLYGNCTRFVDQMGNCGLLNEYVNHTTTGILPAMIINL